MENENENEFICIIPTNKISIDNIFFTDKTNNIIMDGTFMKIIYSSSYCSYNGIYLACPFLISDYLRNEEHEKIELKFNPYIEQNKTWIDYFSKLEEDIIKLYSSKFYLQKMPQYCLRNQLINGYFKIRSGYSTYYNPAPQYVLKISGIWETETTFGISYKIMVNS